jgi:DNA-binding XRE family transcriptional regulator
MMTVKTIPYEALKERSLQDPEVRAAYEALEPSYQVACLRIERGMTQEELAEKVGTRQPNIARLESGQVTPSLPLLQRVAEALDARLVVRIEPK